jgi:predicted CXXCH cytochrome family protein
MPALKWARVLGIALLGLWLSGCRRQEAAAPASATAAATTAPVALTTLPKPADPLPKKAACVTLQCHASFKTAPHIHGPVAAQECKACHQEDQGGHHYPLIRQGNAMCTFCHAVAGTKEWQHKALDQAAVTQPAGGASGAKTGVAGGCLTCHQPHTSRAKFLLTTDNVQALCAKCHEEPLKRFAHEPFKEGQCTVCHQAHQADNKKLLRYGAGPDHCYGCHTDKQKAMTQLPHVHKAAAQDCTTCHSPHATENKNQLKKPVNDMCLGCHKKVQAELAGAKVVHGAVTEGNCASCHNPHASAQPADLKARTDKVCMTCHDVDVKAADGRILPGMAKVMASSNLHGPVKSGGCSECHKPHAADQPNLLKKRAPETFYARFDIDSYELCFSCHDQQLVLKPRTILTNFRDGDNNLHYVHVNREKGRTCKACHDVHGSDLPKHLAASVPFEGSSWSMPINFVGTADGGTCSPGCHEPKSYSRAKSAKGAGGAETSAGNAGNTGTAPAGGQP